MCAMAWHKCTQARHNALVESVYMLCQGERSASLYFLYIKKTPHQTLQAAGGEKPQLESIFLGKPTSRCTKLWGGVRYAV